MDHSEALKTKAAERYLLGEMEGEERARFEEHYFGCPECAGDVASGTTFLANLKAALKAPRISQRAAANGTRRRWIPMALAACLALSFTGLAGYEHFVTVPQLRQQAVAVHPQPLLAVSLMASASRGAGASHVSVADGQPFSLLLDIPTQPGYASYLCELRTAGARDFDVPLSSAQASETVNLLVPGRSLKPGEHEVVVRGVSASGAAGEVIAHYSFQLEVR